MKVTICGSSAFFNEMRSISKRLKEIGVAPVLPLSAEKYDKPPKEIFPYDQFIEIKRELIKDHFDKINKSDAILVVNGSKGGIDGYIGGATFAEIAYAFHLGKKIFFLNKIPEIPNIVDELKAYNPIILSGIEDIKDFA